MISILSDLPWTEKYRPHNLSEVIGQEMIINRLNDFVKNKNFPNMIFAGSAGIGKTTCAIAMANDLYKTDISSAFKELNASDSRGIEVIRGEVKQFAKTISLAKVPIKIIFLDEADSLTADAQHALRRTMEKFSSETRFILSANYASKIIDPIQSRCVVFRFKPLNEDDVKKYIKRITVNEKLEIDEKAINALIYISEGDLRKLTNVMQAASMQNKKLTEEIIYEISARARPKEISLMLKYATSKNFDKAIAELDKLILRYGMSGEDILTQCYREIQKIDMDEHIKLVIISNLGETNFRIIEGANERIQLEAMLANIALSIK